MFLARAIDSPEHGDQNIGGESNLDFLRNRRIFAGKVTTLQGDPIRGAKVDVESLSAPGGFRSLTTDLQGGFKTEYLFNAELVKEFSVILTVTKKGFLKAHETIDLGDSSQGVDYYRYAAGAGGGPETALAGRSDLKACAQAEEAGSFRGALGCRGKGLCAWCGGVPGPEAVQTEPCRPSPR